MVDRYLSSKFGVNLFRGIQEIDVYGRRTDNGRPRDDSSSAVQQHKAVTAKNGLEIWWIASYLFTKLGIDSVNGF